MVVASPPPYYRPMPKTRPAYNQAEPTTPLGKFIRAQRDHRGWGQEDVAAAAGGNLTASEVSNIERGQRGLPLPPRMIAIARAFDMHVCELYVAAGYPEFGEHSRRTYSRTVVEDEQHRAS
jgi:transcriptional regulator with XRE-family HTH domain